MIPATVNYRSAEANFLSGKIPFKITISGYTRIFTNYSPGTGEYDWLVSIDDQTITIQDLDGGMDLTQLCFTVQDRGAAITGDFPGFVFEGKQVTLQAGLPGLAEADFVTLFVGYIDSVSSANGNSDYYFQCSDISAKLSQVVYPIGDDGVNPTSSTNPKTLLGHPLDIMQDVLLNQVALPAGFVNSTNINAYKTSVYSGVQFKLKVTQPPAAADFIKAQLMKPLGGYMFTNSGGQIDVRFFYPLAGPVALGTLTPANWTGIPSADQSEMVNTVQFQFDKDDGTSTSSGNYLSQDTETYGPSVSLYGQYGEHVIQADGLRSAFQGFFIAKLVSRLYFYRYGLKNLLFDQNSADGIWQTVRYEVGDIIAVTHPSIPDRKAGVMGITNKLFEVKGKRINHNQGLVMYTLIDASYLSTFGLYKIAPVSEPDYVPDAAKATYMYMSDVTGHYSNSDPGHALG